MGRSKRYYAKYLAVFTLAFIVMFYFCYAEWFYKAGKTFFRSFDGLDQHYLIFLYIGNLIRDFFYNLFYNHEFVIPLWNMGIGYGSDIPTSLGAYLPDPFNWISAFFPGVHSQFGYCLMIVAKVYAAGLAFSYFCFHKGAGRMETLAGSLVYVFSGTMYIIFIESFFVNPMYIFPLLLIGVDNLWKNGRSALYVAALAFSFINYLYFAYMMCLFVFLYVMLRFALLEGKRRSMSFFLIQVKRFMVNSLFALGISMVVVLPIILVLGNAGRLGVHYYLPWLFGKSYYAGVLSGFANSYSMLGRDCILGFGSIGLMAAILLFLNREKKYTGLRISFIVLTIMLLIPFAGSVMNGFSYTANRWVWAYTFVVSYVVTVMFPGLLNLSAEIKKKLVGTVIVYVALVFILNHMNAGLRNTFISIVVMTVVVLFLYKIPDKYRKWALLCVTCISLYVPAMNYFRSGRGYGNALAFEVPRGTAYKAVYGNQTAPLMEKVAAEGPDKRYDKWGFGPVRNTSWLYGIGGMDMYISIYNNNIDRFHNDLALMTGTAPMDYNGLDRRSELEWLMNVRHYLTVERLRDGRPWGFTKLTGRNKAGNDTFSSYAAAKENSLVHGFLTVMSMDDFRKLSPYERQQALMKAVFTDDMEPAGEIPGKSAFKKNEVKYRIKVDNGLTWQDGIVRTTRKDGKLHLKLNHIKNCELYLYVDGVAEDGFNKADGTFFYADALFKGKRIPSAHAERWTATNRTHMYGGKHKWLINLGIVKDADEIVMTWPGKTETTLRKITVYAKPVSEIKSSVNGLVSLTDQVNFFNNGFTFNLKTDELPYMLVSVPYSKGWTAYVDGEKRDIHLADDAFMVLPVNKGDKEVKFTYVTPGLLPGLGISLISLIGYSVFWKKKIL